MLYSYVSELKLLEYRILPSFYFSEAGNYHRIWNTTYCAFDGCQIMAKIGEKSRNASAARQNQNQALATTERRANRTMGHRIDVIYKYKGFKLGCIEIGNDSITRTDNRYMNDGMIKLPKCLGDMFYILANEHPERINNLVTYNLIIISEYNYIRDICKV